MPINQRHSYEFFFDLISMAKLLLNKKHVRCETVVENVLLTQLDFIFKYILHTISFYPGHQILLTIKYYIIYIEVSYHNCDDI